MVLDLLQQYSPSSVPNLKVELWVCPNFQVLPSSDLRMRNRCRQSSANRTCFRGDCEHKILSCLKIFSSSIARFKLLSET